MRNAATFIVSLALLAACGTKEEPKAKESAYKPGYKPGKDERIEIIGEARVPLNLGSIPPSLSLDLKAPATLKKRFFAFERPGSSKIVEKEITLTNKGKSNGTIELELSTHPI